MIARIIAWLRPLLCVAWDHRMLAVRMRDSKGGGFRIASYRCQRCGFTSERLT